MFYYLYPSILFLRVRFGTGPQKQVTCSPLGCIDRGRLNFAILANIFPGEQAITSTILSGVFNSFVCCTNGARRKVTVELAVHQFFRPMLRVVELSDFSFFGRGTFIFRRQKKKGGRYNVVNSGTKRGNEWNIANIDVRIHLIGNR